MRLRLAKRVLPNKKQINKVHKLWGHYFKLVPCSRKEEDWLAGWYCELSCDLFKFSKTHIDCMPGKTKKKYCCGYVYKELDGLHADLHKVSKRSRRK